LGRPIAPRAGVLDLTAWRGGLPNVVGEASAGQRAGTPGATNLIMVREIP
jgi:hypothetical protein